MPEEITLEESIYQLLQKVPEPVRAFILNDLSKATQDLMDKYQLHVDQGGVLERELLLMLLGQETPAGFAESLKEAKIPGTLVQTILTDVNESVFKKVRAAEQEAAARVEMRPSETPKPQLPPVPTIQPAQPAPTPAQAPVPMPAPQPEVPAPAMRTMKGDMDLVKSGQLQSTPRPASPWEASAHTPSPAPAPTQPSAPQPSVPAGTPVPKGYTMDPYREPVQ